jgi:hypothetical protein
MKTVLRVAFIMAFVLSIGAAAFAQHYKQTNLVSNTSGVSPSSAHPDEAPAAEVYFTAVRNKGTGGLFGYLNAVSTDLTEGNAQ